MSIRSRLVLLVLVVLVPAVLASLVGMAYVYKERERSVETSLLETSRALSLVVDREIGRKESFLRLLASSPTLREDEMDRFKVVMKNAAEASGARVLLWENGVPLISSDERDSASWTRPEDILADQPDPHVSDLFTDATGELSYAISMPILIDGTPRFHLAMVSRVTDFQNMFEIVDLPSGWTGAIFDRHAMIVGRNIRPERHVGNAATPDVAKRLREGDYGFFKSVTRDGVDVIAAFSRAPASGWSFIVGVPVDQVDRSAADALRMMTVLAVLLLGAAVILAAWVGRRIVAPMRMLTEQAHALGRGEELTPKPTGLAETDVVSTSLSRASLQIHSAKEIMEKQVAEAVAASERSQAALLQSQKLEALGRLTGGIAHDFNNLLQTLSTGLHLADYLTTNKDAKNALSSCKSAVGRAAKLTHQLMAFGKNQISEARRVDLRDQLLAMKDLLHGALRSDIEVVFSITDDLWPVYADPLQLELAILNLAINARDATPGTGIVHITADNIRLNADEISGVSEGDHVRLTFSDSGTGMPPEVMEKALEPFFTTKPAGKGSGLGLAQIYGFVKQVSGGMTIASRENEGTTVTLYLPRSLANETSAQTPQAPGPAESVTDALVLVVEDDVLVRDVLVPALRAHGFRVIPAVDADEAMEILHRQSVDIVFSDIVMPGSMNGIALALELRENFPLTPIILATGYTEDPALPENIQVIPKPYDISTVAKALRQILSDTKP